MKIDHITVAGPDLRDLQNALNQVGISCEYGGLHSNRVTHMSLVGFRDGSYLELVSTVTPGGRVPLWTDHELPSVVGTAWTIEVPDVAAEVKRARGLGAGGRDPIAVRRHRPDGVVGHWELAYLSTQPDVGDCQPGGLLPFLIHDFTPREVRVKPSPAIPECLQGWSTVALAVNDLEPRIALFRRIYDWPAPEIGITYSGDRIAAFRNSPVTLLSPLRDSPLAAHLRVYGECPYAAVLRTTDASLARRNFKFGAADELIGIGGIGVQWLDLTWDGPKIGLEL